MYNIEITLTISIVFIIINAYSLRNWFTLVQQNMYFLNQTFIHLLLSFFWLLRFTVQNIYIDHSTKNSELVISSAESRPHIFLYLKSGSVTQPFVYENLCAMCIQWLTGCQRCLTCAGKRYARTYARATRTWSRRCPRVLGGWFNPVSARWIQAESLVGDAVKSGQVSRAPLHYMFTSED